MRIANIFEEGKIGGPQIYIMRLASSLRDKISMTLIMPEDNCDAFRAQCETNKLKYKTLKISHITKEWRVAIRYLLCFPFEIAFITKELQKGNFDIVYVCGGSWQYKGAIAGKLAGKKVIWHLNDSRMPWLFRKIFNCLSGLADGYVYASERSKEYYGALVKSKNPEFIIPAPVDTKRFDSTKDYHGDEELIEKWSNKVVIGTIANINPIKNFETFIRAASLVNGSIKGAGVHFVVIGPVFDNQRRYFESLRQLCRDLKVDNIEFTSERTNVRPLLKRFDVYVCSSKAESSPIAVWEAMAMAKPIVSTDVGDVPLYIKSGENGFIVKVGDSKGIADRLIQLINDDLLRRSFGRKARETVVAELDISMCAEKHLIAYRDILYRN